MSASFEESPNDVSSLLTESSSLATQSSSSVSDDITNCVFRGSISSIKAKVPATILLALFDVLTGLAIDSSFNGVSAFFVLFNLLDGSATVVSFTDEFSFFVGESARLTTGSTSGGSTGGDQLVIQLVVKLVCLHE